MPVLKAEELLREHGHEMSPEAMRRAVLEVTGSQDEADRAYAQRVLSQSREAGE